MINLIWIWVVDFLRKISKSKDSDYTADERREGWLGHSSVYWILQVIQSALFTPIELCESQRVCFTASTLSWYEIQVCMSPYMNSVASLSSLNALLGKNV